MNKSGRWSDSKEEVFALKFNLIDKFSSVFLSLSLSFTLVHECSARYTCIPSKKQIYFHKNDDSQEGHDEEITGEEKSGCKPIFIISIRHAI